MNIQRPLTGAERVARRRATLRAQGLRPRTFWLPDPLIEANREQARRDVERLWALESEDAESMAWAQAMTDELLRDHPY